MRLLFWLASARTPKSREEIGAAFGISPKQGGRDVDSLRLTGADIAEVRSGRKFVYKLRRLPGNVLL